MITRPAHQADNLRLKIEQANGQVLLYPTLQISPVTLNDTDIHRLQQLASYDIAIFISPNAVQFGLEQINRYSSIPATLKLATIGQGSARQLFQLLGRQPDIMPTHQFDSEGLLATPDMQQVNNKRVLIFRGNGGREQLADTLRERGAEVDYIGVYSRQVPDNSNDMLMQYLRNQQLKAIVINSGESLRNLVSMVPAELHHCLLEVPLVTINQRIATIAQQLGFTQKPVLAHSPDDDAIVNTLKENHLLG